MTDISHIFNDCQSSHSSYRKLCQDLRHVQTQNKSSQQFIFDFIKHLNQILACKKNEPWVQKSLKLITSFIQFSYGRDLQKSTSDDSIHFRFTEFMIKYLLQGVESKEKYVRSRICHILSCCMYSLDEMSDALWSTAKEKLLSRLYDKEASVRVQAVACLSRFQDSQDVISRAFIELLQYDPSSDVRRTVLLHIDMNPTTISFILERSRDSDTSIRKTLYKEKLQDISPLSLSIQDREIVIKHGLKDREQSVSQACTELLFSHWIKYYDNNLVQLLLAFDVIQHESLCQDILNGYFSIVPNCFSNGFSESIFDSLLPETALIIRCYFEYHKSSDIASSLVPELVKMAQILCQIIENQSDTNPSYESIQKEFIQRQILLIMNSIDISDEAGRRLCCHLFKNMLMNPSTLDSLISLIVNNLFHFIDSEELDPFIIEIICDLRDIFSISESLQAKDMTQVQILAYLRCMGIVKAFLFLLTKRYNKNMIVCLLNEIIIPSVNSNLLAIQTYGLECLGLVCLLDSNLAKQYMGLFIDFFKMGNTKSNVLKIIFDVLTLFGLECIDESTVQLLTSSLYSTDKNIQGIACEGFSKLYLLHILDDIQILEALLFLYFHPSTTHSPRVKQCLAYFVHMFSSSENNQQQIASIFTNLIKSLAPVVDEYNLISPVDMMMIGQQLIQLTDTKQIEMNCSPHMNIALDICKEMIDSTKYLKLFSHLLTKLNLANNKREMFDKLLAIVGQLLKTYSSEKLISNHLKKVAGTIVAME